MGEILTGDFITVHTFLRLEKCVIGDAIIQMDVKFIGILGKFLAKKKNAVNGLIPHTTIVIRMQKNKDQRNIIIGRNWIRWLQCR